MTIRKEIIDNQIAAGEQVRKGKDMPILNDF